MKPCRRCGGTARYSNGGCAACQTERSAAYRAANRDTIRARRAAYHAANRDTIRERNAAYRAANRDALRAHKAARYWADRDMFREQNAAYRAVNRTKINARTRQIRNERKRDQTLFAVFALLAPETAR